MGPPDTPYEFGFFEVSAARNLEAISAFMSFADTAAVVVFSQIWTRYAHVPRLQTISETGLVIINPDYPTKAPNVTALTTNSGRSRFNPNIYSTGKVCL